MHLMLSVPPLMASIITLLFWQAPDVVDLAQSCKHLFVLFINRRRSVTPRSWIIQTFWVQVFNV
jgi:hypothetical protein